MPYAVTHVILTIIIADMYRDYVAKKKFSMWYVLIAGIAGLLPDADIPLSFGTSYNFHRLFTHSMLWFILIFLAGLAFFMIKKQEYKVFRWIVPKNAIVMFFMAVAFGWFMHILLDCSISADGYLNIIPTVPLWFCPAPFPGDVAAGIDAIILILWLVHEQWRHEIKDYI